MSSHSFRFLLEENAKKHLSPMEIYQSMIESGKDEKETLLQLAKILEIPFVEVNEEIEVYPTFINKIPFEEAKHFQIAVAFWGNQLTLFSCHPLEPHLVDHISFLLETPLEQAFLTKENLMQMINRSYAGKTETAEVVLEELKDINLESLTKELSPSEDLMDMAHKAPIVKLVNTILFQALKQRASDIHIQPYEQTVMVRYRIDGILYTQMELPKELQEAVISRIKVMAKMDIAERRLPQDGGTSLTASGRMVDVRISTLPSAHGERVVFRLQDKSSGLYDLQKIGLEEDQLQQILSLIYLSHGIILVTGPTGSGKTTTLYSALREINSPEKNIITIEDPIEYLLEGISQTQVSMKKGFTFATGLRSIVRQDPDVIMIGEIRDLETARIAIQSALTGHLVFSTLHTNDAPGAITRLLDIGIEPYLVASSLLAVIAQRLVRKICMSCKIAYTPIPEEWHDLGFINGFQNKERPQILYRGKGCSQCFETGYSGRTGIYEILAIDEDIKKQILDRMASSQIKTIAIQKGKLTTLRMAAISKLFQGVTTASEVLRVTQDINV